jgi:aryl-alcohol dehydrogenase-like predicted oxidoreductase
VEALQRYADERGVSLLHVAIGGLAAQPAVASVIAGATRPEQVLANVAAGTWEPTAEDLAALNAV